MEASPWDSEGQEVWKVDGLNNVMRDAVSVCLGLGIQYLWVDALCIVQDRGGDFEAEALRMQDVYAGSVVTIVAASSTDTTNPFLKERDSRDWLDCKMWHG